MWKNYLKIAVRKMRRQPGYTFINVAGLSMALTACLLIGLFVYQELSHDRFHEHADRIFRVLSMRGEDNPRTFALTPIPLGNQMERTYPEVEAAVRIDQEQGIVQHSSESTEERLLFVDANFFEVFSFPLARGTPAQVLSDPQSLVLSPSAARRYFNSTEVIGRTLTIEIVDYGQHEFTVRGVTDPIPATSSITFDILLPITAMANLSDRYQKNPWRGDLVTYLQLSSRTAADDLEQKLPTFIRDHLPNRLAQQTRFDLQPLTEVHFTPGLFGSLSSGSRRVYSYILSGIGLLILLVACSNFATLAVGRSARRLREVGVRKTLGARRSQLMGQFWNEALLTTVVATGTAVILARLLLPLFSKLVGQELSLTLLTEPWIIGVVVGLAGLTGLIAGSYPAGYLSHFQPASVLRGQAIFHKESHLVRGLVTMQFAISIGLIAAALLMHQQMNLIHFKSLGLDEEQVVRLKVMKYREGDQLLQRYRSILAGEPAVRSVAGSWQLLGGGEGVSFGNRYQVTSAGRTIETRIFRTSDNILKTLGMRLLQGRAFSEHRSGDDHKEAIVTEALVEALGWQDSLGRVLDIRAPWIDDLQVIGVVENFHFQSLHQPIEPLVIGRGSAMTALYAHIGPGSPEESLSALRRAWKEVAPDQPFNFTFLDQQIQRQYETERRWARIITYASVFAIGIACMGLFGLAMLAASRRRKEIGIRKVLGASVPSIVGLISKDFLKLVLIGFALAAPLAYLGAQRWLENFAYRIDLGPTIFIVAGLVAVAIAFLTVSYQAIKTALANPAESLRCE